MAPKLTPKTKLEKAVAAWINDQARDYDNDITGPLKDLFYGGCQSGIVGSLIYYTDTLKFYRKHRTEIDALLAEICDSNGESPAALFGKKWDKSDPLARETQNQNLLAWFGFEETAHRLADRAGIEI